MVDRKRVAVLFGGRSVEHDISIVSGLQALAALDSGRFDAFPVYVDFSGAFWCGNDLRERKNFIPDAALRANLDRVSLDVSTPGAPQWLSTKAQGLFGGGKRASYPFDVALLVFHGTFGEDGSIQGLLDFHGIPYTGMRTMAAAVAMDKIATKQLLAGSGVETLPHVMIERPTSGFIVPVETLRGLVAELAFPLIVKPATLGSSIGVALVKDLDELAAVLPGVLKLDDRAVVEPAVQNLVEYNVSVCRLFGGEVRVSAIERPKSASALLDFKQKYLSGSGAKKSGGAGQNSGGMLSLTRDINPDMPAAIREKVVGWSKIAFERLGGAGAPRIDYLSNRETGQVYLNEVNACPGSLAYFLWEAAEEPVLFTDYLTALIEEGLRLKRPQSQFSDPVPEGARLFSKRG